jgi:tRNA uridine 5-carboxymethylaminomethyl modification enzyme
MGRLKTGTCPRLNGDTINFSDLERQSGDSPAPMFSFFSDGPALPQVACHVTYTNTATHEIIRSGLDRSPLFCGIIKGKGPRYCPSIEDKIVRFPDRERHQIFLEPEGLESNEFYPNGISTSLPEDIQLRLVRTIKGLEEAEILKFGYAVEYDFVSPTQLSPTLMLKNHPGLFCAGQINGTSGYEEAAGQGLMAGVNAALHVQKREPFILARDQAYIGVMIDDLVTKGTSEPYRMFTSRVEHRMLLREDNADARLTPLAKKLGLVTDSRWSMFERKHKKVTAAMAALKSLRLKDGTDSHTLAEILRRPGVAYADLKTLCENLPGLAVNEMNAVETMVKFEGYIDRERLRIDKIGKMAERKIPDGIEYDRVPGLTREVAERFKDVQPVTIGQASRIPGVTPAAISMLVIHLWSKT